MAKHLSSGEAATPAARRESRSERAIEQIRQALSGLRYGQVCVIVQDGVVIQIERTERTRLDRIDS